MEWIIVDLPEALGPMNIVNGLSSMVAFLMLLTFQILASDMVTMSMPNIGIKEAMYKF